MLHQIDRSVNSNISLNVVAKSDKLFLRRDNDFDIKPLPLNELAQLVIVIKDLLQTLKRTAGRRSGVKTIAEGNELLDLTLDETYLSNLEHLLLCLREQILRLVVAKLFNAQKHLIECQKDQDKHSDADWFSEFPDARHPLSTTWPWSIKPSLAVIWGVCWMFYGMDGLFDMNETAFDEAGNMVDREGNMVFSASDIDQILAQQTRRQQMPFGASGELRASFI